jgi:hypothetical protein
MSESTRCSLPCQPVEGRSELRLHYLGIREDPPEDQRSNQIAGQQQAPHAKQLDERLSITAREP